MIITENNFRDSDIGAKAKNLFIMKANGINVPDFFCVDTDSAENAVSFIQENFPNISLFSVRSSSSAEDGKSASFAGQFNTFLNVKKDDIPQYIKKTAEQKFTAGFLEYCRKNDINSDNIKITVIVQKMIQADISGVIFTAEPRGLLNETVITVGSGTGDNIVEDKTDTATYYFNKTDKLYYCEKSGNAPLISGELVKKLVRISEKIRSIFKTECDIEFAVKNTRIYILQARPITTIPKSDALIILDNSNIVESYPEITLPLTQSFVKEAYYGVFRSVLMRLTEDKKAVKNADDILRNMVDSFSGRIYYRISNWYDIILFLPFSEKIIPVWQEMLGVKTKTVTSHGKNNIGAYTHFKVTINFFRLLLGCPKSMRELDGYFSDICEKFSSVDLNSATNSEILAHYKNIKAMTFEKWDLTLVNDMYSFIYTGLLKAWLKAVKYPSPDETANRCISGINGIESMKPVNMLISISAQAKKENRISRLKMIRTNEDFYKYISQKNDTFSRRILRYIELYGDRSVNELKLESKTFRTDPVLLVKQIIQYAENDIISPAEKKSAPPKLDIIGNHLAKKSALGIKNRERSRLHRSRLYGMMRSMMLEIGQNLADSGQISCREDIFYLTFEQVENAVFSEKNMMASVEASKIKYSNYESIPTYSRLVFAGEIFDKEPRAQIKTYRGKNGAFRGIPCSSGIAEGEVVIVKSASDNVDTAGKIIVAKTTEPSFVFMIAGANGIIAEKGSILSHTAIISRELKKPSVVGIDGITEALKNGDIVRINGGTGEIVVLSQGEE